MMGCDTCSDDDDDDDDYDDDDNDDDDDADDDADDAGDRDDAKKIMGQPNFLDVAIFMCCSTRTCRQHCTDSTPSASR